MYARKHIFQQRSMCWVSITPSEKQGKLNHNEASTQGEGWSNLHPSYNSLWRKIYSFNLVSHKKAQKIDRIILKIRVAERAYTALKNWCDIDWAPHILSCMDSSPKQLWHKGKQTKSLTLSCRPKPLKHKWISSKIEHDSSNLGSMIAQDTIWKYFNQKEIVCK